MPSVLQVNSYLVPPPDGIFFAGAGTMFVAPDNTGYAQEVIPPPDDVQVGDLLLLWFSSEGATGVRILEVGQWTDAAAVPGAYQQVYYRIATGDANDTATRVAKGVGAPAHVIIQMAAFRSIVPGTLAYHSRSTGFTVYQGATVYGSVGHGFLNDASVTGGATEPTLHLSIYSRAYHRPGTGVSTNSVLSTPFGGEEIGSGANWFLEGGTNHNLWGGWSYLYEAEATAQPAEQILYDEHMTNNIVSAQNIRFENTP